MVLFNKLRIASSKIMISDGVSQHKAMTACMLVFLLSSICVVAACGSSSSLFTCFPASTQTWSPPSTHTYEQTEDLGGQDTGNVHTDDPAQVDQTTAAGCARQLLAKLPTSITTVQAALDNMYVNDEIVVADELVKQLPGSLLQSLVQTRPGRLLVFHLFLDVAGEDSGIGPEPTGPAGDPAMAQKLYQMLLTSFPDFQRLYNQPWLSDPTIEAAASQHGTSFQTLAEGNGPYRFDDFTIIIQHMPPGLTPQSFLGEMAQDMNKAANNQQFNDLSTFKWRDTSHPPMIGDINDINFGSAWGLPAPGVPSPVMLVEKTDTHFVFQTLQGHILYGTREFGFYALPDGHVLLYTRAISRDSSILSHVGGTAGHANELQVRTWTNFMIGVCNEMQRRGGSCNPQSPDAGEQPWSRRLNLSQSPTSPTAVRLTVVKDIGNQTSPSAKWDIEYAQISGLTDQAVESAINAKLREDPENAKVQFLNSLANYQLSPGDGISEIDMAVAGNYLTSKLVSVGYTGYENVAGAAHGLNLDDSLNFDLASGKVLTNRDLVNPGTPGSGDQEQNFQALKGAVSQLVQSQLGPDSGCIVDQSKLIGAIDDPSPLFFTDQGAMIGYPNYTFGANPCGFSPALIPYTKLAGIINPIYFPHSPPAS